MTKLLLLIVFLCHVSILHSKSEVLDMNEGHRYNEEKELLKINSKRLQETLGENAAEIHSNCLRKENKRELFF